MAFDSLPRGTRRDPFRRLIDVRRGGIPQRRVASECRVSMHGSARMCDDGVRGRRKSKRHWRRCRQVALHLPFLKQGCVGRVVLDGPQRRARLLLRATIVRRARGDNPLGGLRQFDLSEKCELSLNQTKSDLRNAALVETQVVTAPCNRMVCRAMDW